MALDDGLDDPDGLGTEAAERNIVAKTMMLRPCSTDYTDGPDEERRIKDQGYWKLVPDNWHLARSAWNFRASGAAQSSIINLESRMCGLLHFRLTAANPGLFYSSNGDSICASLYAGRGFLPGCKPTPSRPDADGRVSSVRHLAIRAPARPGLDADRKYGKNPGLSLKACARGAQKVPKSDIEPQSTQRIGAYGVESRPSPDSVLSVASVVNPISVLGKVAVK